MPNAASSNARRMLLTAILVMTLANLAACNGVDKAHWTEEVRLHDGSMIVVERQAGRRHSGFPNAPRGVEIDYDLAYAPLNLHWHGLAPKPPISFDVVDGIPYLAVYAEGSEFCTGKDAGQYEAQFFHWENGGWSEITQSRFPIDDTLMNLDLDPWGHREKNDPRGLVKWADKAARNMYYPDKPYTVRHWYEKFRHFCKSP